MYCEAKKALKDARSREVVLQLSERGWDELNRDREKKELELLESKVRVRVGVSINIRIRV
jgi:hypothetical protein